MEAAVSYFLPRLRPGGQLVVPWGEAGAAWVEVGAAFGEAEGQTGAARVQPRQIGSCPACPPPDGVVDTIGTQKNYLQTLCCELKKIAHFLVVSVFCISTKYSNR
jgi:hypothetical protein